MSGDGGGRGKRQDISGSVNAGRAGSACPASPFGSGTSAPLGKERRRAKGERLEGVTVLVFAQETLRDPVQDLLTCPAAFVVAEVEDVLDQAGCLPPAPQVVQEQFLRGVWFVVGGCFV